MSDLHGDIRDVFEEEEVLGIWEKLPSSHKRRHLNWIDEAKREDTRARRTRKAASMLKNDA